MAELLTKYQQYAEYKNSGVEWLGEIPKDWQVVRLKYIAELSGNKTSGSANQYVGLENVESKTGKFKVTEGIVSEGVSNTFEKDNLLFGKLRPYLAKSWLASFSGICSSEFLVLDSKLIHPKFLKYMTLTDEFIEQVNSSTYGTKMPRASWDFIGLLPLPVMDYDLSKTIANFLDHETAQIDTLIDKQQTLIQLLKEKRQAVISHAVTKGLNPDAPMKDSGVEWLGEVPEHWVVQSIKYAFESLNFRRIPLSSEIRGERKGFFRYYGASGVIDYVDDYIFDEPTVLVGEDGANLVSRNTPLAFSAHGKYWVNNHAHILRPKDAFADYWAEVIEHIDVNPIVSGSAQPKLTAEALSNLIIAFPPETEERAQIDTYIKKRKEKYGDLIKKAEQAIQLMQERRTALISAAVTGKIDVRGWQAPE